MEKVTGVVLLTIFVGTDAPARTSPPPAALVPRATYIEPERPLIEGGGRCCLQSHDYRPRTQFVTEMLRSVEAL
jgi:hypothetical protein